MSVMKVKCTDQVLKIVEAPTIASGGVNEVRVEFEFCEKWDGFEKTALFYQNEDEIYYAILDENNACYVPWEVCYSNGTFYFSVFGNKGETRRTSTTIKYKVTKGVISEIMMPSVPTPGVYEQLLAKLEEVKGTIPADDEVNFLVHLDSVNYEPTSDKTYAQILEASNAGKQVLGVCGDVKYVCGGPYDRSEHFVFYPVYHSGMFYLQHEVTVKKDNTWSSSEVRLPDDIHINSMIDAKVRTDEEINELIDAKVPLEVSFWRNTDNEWVCGKTYEEIVEAAHKGRMIVGGFGDIKYTTNISQDNENPSFVRFDPLYAVNSYVSKYYAFFVYPDEVKAYSYEAPKDDHINELIDAKVPSDEHIIELVEQNAPEGITEEEVNDLISAKVAGVLTVNFSIGSPNTPASADKTYAEIKEALNSGNTLEGRYNGKSFVYAGTNRSGDISFKQPVYMNDLASVDPQNYGYLITIKSDNNVTFETIAPWGAAGDLIDGIPQADWNQSDSEARDYLKNKPFYESLEETTVTREFDGESKLFDPDFCELLFEKRSEAVHIVEGTVFSYIGNDSEWSGGWSYSISDGVSTYYVIAMEGSGSSDVDGLVIMTAGGTYKPGSISITVEAMVVHPLDEKFIPDTIARMDASPVVWVNATLNGESVTADRDFNYLMANFTDKVIMCKLSDAYNRWLLVCSHYNSDDAVFDFGPICVGVLLSGAFPGLSCSPAGWTYHEVYPVG